MARSFGKPTLPPPEKLEELLYETTQRLQIKQALSKKGVRIMVHPTKAYLARAGKISTRSTFMDNSRIAFRPEEYRP
jgi:hypothetical protein